MNAKAWSPTGYELHDKLTFLARATFREQKMCEDIGSCMSMERRELDVYLLF